jgi:hypothetical protein
MFPMNQLMYITTRDHRLMKELFGLKVTGYTAAVVTYTTVAIGPGAAKTAPGLKAIGNTTTAAIAGIEATGNNS